MDGQIYVPLPQATSTPQNLALVARMGDDPAGFEESIPRLVREACPACAVSRVAGMDTVVAVAPRSLARLVGGFAWIALLLASAGIYGVVSHRVARRTRELGVRLPLGASPARVAWLVAHAGLRQVAVGALAGLAASWALARWIAALLVEVRGHAPLSFLLPPVLLAGVGLLASLVPMVRAARHRSARSLREG